MDQFEFSDKEKKQLQKSEGLQARLAECAALVEIKDKATGSLVLQVAQHWKEDEADAARRVTILTWIQEGLLSSSQQVSEALKLARTLESWEDEEAVKLACGVGVEVTAQQVDEMVARVLEQHRDTLEVERYTCAGKLRGELMREGDIKWADSKVVNKAWNAGLLRVLGDKKAPENDPKAVRKRIKQLAEEEAKRGSGIKLLPPDQNTQARPELLEEHLKATGGKVVTRFPPEPNGYLHFGHCKAINIDFGHAARNDGICYLRFDDTNPMAEKQEYIDSIMADVEWLGFKPYKVTHSSDYFQKLYELAVELIKRDKAFVCHQSKQESKEYRDARRESPWRNRPIEESLREFERMKNGCYAEGEAVLRVKADVQSDNPNMRDFVAYRIKYVPHPKAGDKWCIYPSYDYTHCICDSLENITHSLCTLEFQVRNETYRWLLDALDMYKPPQIESSRLNLEYTVTSKRKCLQLIREGHVTGWDDPRMATIMGLRRRGYTPDALNSLVVETGLTKANNVCKMDRLEQALRQDLNAKAPRVMSALRPVLLTVVNWGDKPSETYEVPDMPKAKGGATHTLSFSGKVYVDRSDWRDEDSEDYYRLAPNKICRLKYSTCVKVVGVERDAQGVVTEIKAEAVPEPDTKVKGTISWVSLEDAHPATVRIFGRLFNVPNPGAERPFTEDINPDSLQVIEGAMVERRIANAPVGSHFQFERIGYFCVDKDSAPGAPVFNLSVTQKEDKGK